MSEHEMLNIVCDKIWYKPDYNNINVIEIIFTTEFIDKFEKYLWETDFKKNVYDKYKISTYITFFRNELLSNLNNTVEYLYNIIK